MAKLTTDQWLAEFDRLQRERSEQAADGMTMQEIADGLDVCVKTARIKMNRAVRDGLATCVGHRPSTTIDGKPCFTPVYTLKSAGD